MYRQNLFIHKEKQFQTNLSILSKGKEKKRKTFTIQSSLLAFHESSAFGARMLLWLKFLTELPWWNSNFQSFNKGAWNFNSFSFCILQADFKLMCDNAMTYNRPDTVYYKLAKKILHTGFKMMSKVRDLLKTKQKYFVLGLLVFQSF